MPDAWGNATRVTLHGHPLDFFFFPRGLVPYRRAHFFASLGLLANIHRRCFTDRNGMIYLLSEPRSFGNRQATDPIRCELGVCGRRHLERQEGLRGHTHSRYPSSAMSMR